MTHGRAVATMVAVTLMWSLAGVVSRHFEAVQGAEATFWRSAFNLLALTAGLAWLRGPAALRASIVGGGRPLWLSGACWAVMFTAFMVAITMTSVANVLVTMAIAPLLTALIARVALRHPLPPRTWAAIAVAGAGIAWMYGGEARVGDARHAVGTAVALLVPLAAALNWVLIQHHGRRDGPDLLPAVALGAALSAAATLPFALPFAATASDLGWLALLGTVQLAVPCLLSVVVARALSAPEISLLSLLEIVFGVTWAWLGAGERPSWSVLGGGGLVLAALVANELFALRRGRGVGPPRPRSSALRDETAG